MRGRTWDEIALERRARFSLCSSCMQYYVSNCPITLDEARQTKRCNFRKYKFYKTNNFASENAVMRAFPEEYEIIKTGESNDKQ